MGVFRSWGGCLDTLIITYTLGLSGTCADSIARCCQRSIARRWVSVCHGYVRVGWGENLKSKRFMLMARHPGRSWAHDT
eukprot:4053158-Prymnesium_polylepis.1